MPAANANFEPLVCVNLWSGTAVRTAARDLLCHSALAGHFGGRESCSLLTLIFLFAGPMLLMLWAQMRVKSAYAAAQQYARSAQRRRRGATCFGLGRLERRRDRRVPGELTDHYDPRAKVLRLSTAVYNGRTLAAVGIAAHEAGHALQDAKSTMRRWRSATPPCRSPILAAASACG